RVDELLEQPQPARRMLPRLVRDPLDGDHPCDTSNGWTLVSKPSGKLLRQRQEQLPGDRRIALYERAEVPRRHSVAAHVGLRDDRRRPVGAGDQRDLAEVVAGLNRAARLAVDADLALALVDDEEARA